MVSPSYKSLVTVLVICGLLAGICPACAAPEITVAKPSHSCCPAGGSDSPAKPEPCPRARFAFDWTGEAATKIAKPMLIAEPAPELMSADSPVWAIGLDAIAAHFRLDVPQLFLLHSSLRI